MDVTETLAWATALYYCERFDDSCPDVGMGPTYEMLFEKVLKKAGVVLSDEDCENILSYYKTNVM